MQACRQLEGAVKRITYQCRGGQACGRLADIMIKLDYRVLLIIVPLLSTNKPAVREERKRERERGTSIDMATRTLYTGCC